PAKGAAFPARSPARSMLPPRSGSTRRTGQVHVVPSRLAVTYGSARSRGPPQADDEGGLHRIASVRQLARDEARLVHGLPGRGGHAGSCRAVATAWRQGPLSRIRPVMADVNRQMPYTSTSGISRMPAAATLRGCGTTGF